MIISIITPTLNAAEFLAECMESVRDQRGSGFQVEHLIVDSGSVDGSPEIAASFGARVETLPSWGLFSKINEGIRRSSGQVIGVLAGDDTFLPGALQLVADWHARRTSEWVAGGVRWTDRTGRSLGDVKPPPAWMTLPAYTSLKWSCIAHPSTFMTRSFFDRVGGYDTSYVYEGDFEFFARALEQAPFDRITQSLATHRRHGDNLSMRAGSDRLREHRLTAERYEPSSAVRRFAYQLALRTWLNLASPRWFLLKRLPFLQSVVSAKPAS